MVKSFLATAECCLALSALLTGKVSFPGTDTYDSSLNSYFAAQEASTYPQCIVLPQTAAEVASAVQLLTTGPNRQCKFAVRSGGHSSQPGAANIQDGITIDLRGLKSIDVNEDKTVVSVGVGNTWDLVYAKLDPLGLSVTGGRSARVGVGGLSVGGGISYFSTRYGWTVDTIVNYELVLANGTIVNANETENPDLLWALRGGGNSFGIVTRIDISAFQQGPFWGGIIYLPASNVETHAQEFVNINKADTYDPFSHIMLTWAYSKESGPLILNFLEYTKEGVQNPEEFKALSELPALYSTMRTGNVTDFAIEMAGSQAQIQRRLWATNTLVATEETVKATYTRFNESLKSVEDIEGLTWSYTLEPLPPAIYSRHAATNALGLGDRHAALFMGLFTAGWSQATDDARVKLAVDSIMKAMEEDARALGSWDPFVYYNYAGPSQDPIKSYGEENVERLRSIARKVDPCQVFTKQVPGGFKLK
ncbi:unnamed protein product [Clonostachys rosea]|uniref:FAD-binding PCMH-type domain-containing protein n=1 Tax=Bionectria ochroleuca TaxID=29856 RepID=A0ABY6U1X6_BIOOC|nr:unnamed protein product [Clonostachys rosea]